jgi:hypothetical protein
VRFCARTHHLGEGRFGLWTGRFSESKKCSNVCAIHQQKVIFMGFISKNGDLYGVHHLQMVMW